MTLLFDVEDLQYAFQNELPYEFDDETLEARGICINEFPILILDNFVTAQTDVTSCVNMINVAVVHELIHACGVRDEVGTIRLGHKIMEFC